MILKTYLRLFTEDLDQSLVLLEQLVGRGPDYRFQMPELHLEIAGIGDFCVTAGTAAVLKPLRASQGPLVVDDLVATEALLVAGGAVVTKPVAESATGHYFYVRHPDGSEIEYVQWNPDLVKRLIG